MVHNMELQHYPFTRIQALTKTIEMRLYDEKRSRIKINDLIRFCDISNGECIECVVVNLYIYRDFDQLYERHDKMSIGYERNEDANPSDMHKYYSVDDIIKYGVVGIEIKLI